MPGLKLANIARGEVLADLGGQKVRLCVTLRALAELEGHFGVSGFDSLGERLRVLSAADLIVVLYALSLDGIDLDALPIALPEAISAVVAAFGAMNGPD